jgi:hypothetical protein
MAPQGPAAAAAGGGPNTNPATYNGGAGGSGIVIVRYVTGIASSSYEVWRQSNFTADQLTNTAYSGPEVDPDQDGLNNQQEYLAGTNPTNALSCLILYASTNNMDADGRFLLRWQSVAGKRYTAMAATNLLTGFTNLIPTNLAATPDVNVYTDNVQNSVQRFYRVKVETGN